MHFIGLYYRIKRDCYGFPVNLKTPLNVVCHFLHATGDQLKLPELQNQTSSNQPKTVVHEATIFFQCVVQSELSIFLPLKSDDY